MTAKEYLSRAYLLDKQLNTKLEQIENLRLLATKCTSTLSDERVSTSHDHTKMEHIICKIIDLEAEIDNAIDKLVDTKKEIASAVNAVANPTYRLLLELRYINGKNWSEIAEYLNYEERQIYRMHGEALNEIKMSVKVIECQ